MNIRSFDEIWKQPLRAEPESGDLEDFRAFRIRLLKALLRPVPDDPAVLFQLGNELTRAGKHQEALEVDRKLVNVKQEDPISHYNLACSYSNLGKKDQALNALEKAFELGYLDLEHMEQDPDLDNIKDDPRFMDLLEEHFGLDPDLSEFI